MNWNKLILKLQVLLSPSLWQRLGKVNKKYDEWLWNKMDEGTNEIEPHIFQGTGGSVSKCSVMFAGEIIWIENAPYADARCNPVKYESYFNPSRVTALRFRKLYQEYKVQEILKKEEEFK